jgi:hypothetical protein
VSPHGPRDLSQAFREDLSRTSAEAATRLSTLLRNAYVHGPNNGSWRALTDATRRAFTRLVEAERAVTIELHVGQLLVNEHRVRPTHSEHSAYAFLVEALGSRGVGALRFDAVPGHEELVTFAYALAQTQGEGEAALPALQTALRARGVTSLTLSAPAREAHGPVSSQDRCGRRGDPP